MQENERKLQETEAGAEQTSDNINTQLEESPISEQGLSEDSVVPHTEAEPEVPTEGASEEKDNTTKKIEPKKKRKKSLRK